MPTRHYTKCGILYADDTFVSIWTKRKTTRNTQGLKRARMCPYIVVHLLYDWNPLHNAECSTWVSYCCFRAELKETQRPAAFLNWKGLDDYWLWTEFSEALGNLVFLRSIVVHDCESSQCLLRARHSQKSLGDIVRKHFHGFRSFVFFNLAELPKNNPQM